MHSIFKNKKILFFCPKFFGYETEIKNKLQELGAEVDYFDERPDNDFYTKALIRINKKVIQKKINLYYNNILKEVNKNEYDYVFIVNIEAMTPSILKKLKTQHSEAKYILYTWDSLKNKKYTVEFLPFFERIFSFDRNDSIFFENVSFRPLFYMDSYKTISLNTNIIKYDCAFIGTVHSDRYELLNLLESQLNNLNLTSFFYFFFPSKVQFWMKKMQDKSFKGVKINRFNFKSLTKQETIEVIASSKVIIDIQHPAQSGLTMRTIEMLGACKKIITTNADIENYDFYNPANIFVIDRKNPIIDNDFFTNKYVKVQKDIYYKYSLEGWLSEIFDYKLLLSEIKK